MRDRRLIVARELGVAVFNSKTGKRNFYRHIPGVIPLSYAYLNNEQARISGFPISFGMNWQVTAIDTSSAVSSYSRMAQQDYAYTMSSSTATSFDRSISIDRSIIAERMKQNAERSEITHQFGVALGKAIATVAMALSLDERVHRYKMMANHAFLNYENSIQGNYYIRPFFNKGWGLAIVNLSNGNILNLYLVPDVSPLAQFGSNFLHFVLDGSRKRLFALGVNRIKQGETYVERKGT